MGKKEKKVRLPKKLDLRPPKSQRKKEKDVKKKGVEKQGELEPQDAQEKELGQVEKKVQEREQPISIKEPTIESVIQENRDIIYFTEMASKIFQRCEELMVKDRSSLTYAVNAVLSIQESLLRMKTREDQILNELQAQVGVVTNLFVKLKAMLTEGMEIVSKKIETYKSKVEGQPEKKVRKRREKSEEPQPSLQAPSPLPIPSAPSYLGDDESPWT